LKNSSAILLNTRCEEDSYQDDRGFDPVAVIEHRKKIQKSFKKVLDRKEQL